MPIFETQETFHMVKKLVTLAAETTVSSNDLRTMPGATDEYIRRELAMVLAAKMIEEDLITIEVDHSLADPLDGDIKARAKVKIIQE